MTAEQLFNTEIEIGDDALVELDGVPTFLHYDGPGCRINADTLGVFRSSRGGYVLLTIEQMRELVDEEAV
jgi:hypothetical protein